jgi:hypothetical protein
MLKIENGIYKIASGSVSQMKTNALALMVALYELNSSDGADDAVVLAGIDLIVKQLARDAKQVRRYIEG